MLINKEYNIILACPANNDDLAAGFTDQVVDLPFHAFLIVLSDSVIHFTAPFVASLIKIRTNTPSLKNARDFAEGGPVAGGVNRSGALALAAIIKDIFNLELYGISYVLFKGAAPEEPLFPEIAVLLSVTAAFLPGIVIPKIDMAKAFRGLATINDAAITPAKLIFLNISRRRGERNGVINIPAPSKGSNGMNKL